MLNVFKYAEERGKQEGFLEGMEKGMEKGIAKGIEKGIAETVVRQLYKKLGELPCEYKERILSQDRPTLELIADNIFNIESLSDLDRFLKQ
jgi:flagellar biosynthesis/type III secretory pathway protein FliH